MIDNETSRGGHLQPAPPVEMVGNWRIVRSLGSGGFGHVYEAVHTQCPAKRAAIKFLHKHGEDARRRFKKEAAILARVECDQIVHMYEFGELPEGGQLYIVMELLYGKTLSEYISSYGALQPEMLKTLCQQLVTAIAELHRQGIIHRDIKPHNIIICPRPRGRVRVKLLDFGLCKLESLEAHRTPSGSAVGTLIYAAPELISGKTKRVDHRADIYSFAAVLYEAITGVPLFSAKNLPECINMMLNAHPVRVHSLRADFPRAASRTLHQALAKLPHARPFSIEQLHARLEAELMGWWSGEDSSSLSGSDRRRGRWGAAATMAVALTCLIILVGRYVTAQVVPRWQEQSPFDMQVNSAHEEKPTKASVKQGRGSAQEVSESSHVSKEESLSTLETICVSRPPSFPQAVQGSLPAPGSLNMKVMADSRHPSKTITRPHTEAETRKRRSITSRGRKRPRKRSKSVLSVKREIIESIHDCWPLSQLMCDHSRPLVSVYPLRQSPVVFARSLPRDAQICLEQATKEVEFDSMGHVDIHVRCHELEQKGG